MHPWLALTACGHASLVTPMSVVTPPALLPPPPGVAEPPRQPASASASTTNAIASRLIEPPASSVRERKGLPVVANPDPDAEQAARLENQEPDDEDPVEHGLQLVGVRGVGRRVAEHRKQQRDLPGRPGQHRDEQRAEDRARDRAGATDQHHRDVLHRQQQVERARVEEAADRVEQRTGAAGVEGRDGERDRLVPGQVHPDHAGRDVPVADRRERAPYLRARQVARREREHQQEHEHEQVQLLVLGEHARDVEAVPEQGRHGGGAAHPRPAGELGPGLEDVPADEHQPERDDRQVQPAQPGSQTRMLSMPKPSVRPFGSPEMAAAVYAPIAMKNAWPSETCPAYPVTRLSPMAPIAATEANASSCRMSSGNANGTARPRTTSAATPTHLLVVSSSAMSCAYEVRSPGRPIIPVPPPGSRTARTGAPAAPAASARTR